MSSKTGTLPGTPPNNNNVDLSAVDGSNHGVPLECVDGLKLLVELFCCYNKIKTKALVKQTKKFVPIDPNNKSMGLFYKIKACRNILLFDDNLMILF